MMHEFNTNIAPKIREGFAGVGAFSSQEGTALANAASNLAVQGQQSVAQAQLGQQQLAQQLNAQAWQQAGQRQLSGIGLGAQIGQLPFQNTLAQSAAIQQLGAPIQQNLQAQAQSRYNEFLRTAPENSPWTQLAMGLIGQQTQSFYNPQQQGGLLGALQGGMTGGALAGLPFLSSLPFSPLLGPIGALAGLLT